MHKDIHSLIHYTESSIVSRVIQKTEKKDVTLFCMAKGTGLSEHTSSREAIVYVIDGEGEFVLKGKPIAMQKDRIIFMEKNAKHGIEARENLSFLLILT